MLFKLNTDLITSTDLHRSVGIGWGGGGGGVQSAREFPLYIARWDTLGDSPGENCSLPSSLLLPA